MAGILDKKVRFVDYVITQEGKRQLASGKLRAEYASVTDMHTFYDKAEHDDVNNRIYFEVMERPENVIVLEKDDSGKLIDFNFSPTGSIVGDDIFDKDATATDTLRLTAVTGSAFASTSEQLMRTFLTHFKRNTMVGTYFSNGSNEFRLSTKSLKFAISNSIPFANGPTGETINVNNAEPFFFDSKLTHLKNFMFLPPVNTDGSSYGSYKDLRSLKRETLHDIKQDLGMRAFDEDTLNVESGYKARQDLVGDFGVVNRNKLTRINTPMPKQYQTVIFKKTSKDNNLLIQMFEDSAGAKLTKLDIIDAGAFYDSDATLGRNEKRIFYVGKVFFDDYNVPTFINMFTLIFD